jgi:selenide,water dikinase
LRACSAAGTLRLEMAREMVLVGGGHAHVEVLRRFALDPIEDTHLRVLDPNPRPVYSGMVPGFVAGQYQRRELEIDLSALCDAAGAEFVEQSASRIGPDFVELPDGSRIPFEFASLDIGSTVAGANSPGVSAFALCSRPIATLISEAAELIERASATVPLHVVGAGAAGVELACCLESRRVGPVALVSNEPRILAGSNTRARVRVERALERRGIQVLTNSSVSEIREDAIALASGEVVPSAGAVWATGAASHPLAADSGLPVDERGFVRIERTFLVEGRENLFAVGDCASLPGMGKAGVYAVRSGPLLDRNIRARIAGETLREYTPQADFLSLLNLGDGTAIGSKWGLAFEGRWVMRLKDRIDRAFVARYR